MSAKIIMLSTVAVVLALQTPEARAQETGASSDESEIIVTARKREESILNVPVIETVLTQETLEKYAVTDVFSIANRVPGLVMGSNTGAFGNQVSMRGIGTSTLNHAVDQSVSLNLDGLQLTQGLAYKSGFFDMGQIEVLKGPQALFFGKASPAGVISIRTADPTDEFEVVMRAGYEFEAREKRGELIISGPVGETLKLRLATMYSDLDGFFKRRLVATPLLGGLAPNTSRAPGSKEFMIRGTAIFEPSNQFTARLKLNYDNLKEENPGAQLSSCPDGVDIVPGAVFQYLKGEDCKYDRILTWVEHDPASYPGSPDGLRNGGVMFRNVKQHFGTLELNYDLRDDVTLTSVTGYYKVKNAGFTNSQNSTGYGNPNLADTNFSRRDFTQELRLTSDFKNSPLNFVAGGFYQDAIMKFRNNSIGNVDQGQPKVVIQGDHRVPVKAVSAFGQLIWNITPRLELAGGARWTHEKRSHSIFNTNPGTPAAPRRIGFVVLAVPKISSKELSPEASITYRPTDDLTVFASYKQASKSGSFNTSNVVTDGSDTSFSDEKVKGGEVGVKARAFDRTLTFNLAAYYYKFTDLQVGANELLPNGAIVIRTLNAATAKTKGIDFDATFRPAGLEGLTLNAAVNWNRARFGSFPNAQCWGGQRIQDGCDQVFNAATGRFNAQDLSGRPLNRAPKWMATFGFDYEFPLGDDLKMSIGTATQYSSKFYTSIVLRDDMIQKDFFKTDVNVTLYGPRDSYEVAFIGRNLQNKLTSGTCTNAAFASGGRIGNISGGTTRGPGGVDEVSCQIDRGRELWVRLTLRPTALFGEREAAAPPPAAPPPPPATQTCPDGSVISADSMCPAPPPPPPEAPDTTQKAGERG